eukprot:scaffold1184_cov132-Cylindrotheca_fusiformis.AAC.57
MDDYCDQSLPCRATTSTRVEYDPASRASQVRHAQRQQRISQFYGPLWKVAVELGTHDPRNHTSAANQSTKDNGQPNSEKRKPSAHLRPKGFLGRNDRRLSVAEAMEACEEDAALNEENLSETGLVCRCETVKDGVTLICVDACAYCNSDETVCGINSAQAFYDSATGTRTAIGGVFKYELGLYDTLAVENIGCQEDATGRITSCQTCNVYANDHKCNSCDFQTCTDGRVEEIMDCSNIEQGAIFDFCEDVVIEQGIFQTFSENQFNECLSLSLLGEHEHPALPCSSSKSKSFSSKSSKSSKSKSSKKHSSTDHSSESSKSAKKTKSRRRT